MALGHGPSGDMAADFALHLEVLLDFHRDDDADQGLFYDEVEKVETPEGFAIDGNVRLVTLRSGKTLRITITEPD